MKHNAIAFLVMLIFLSACTELAAKPAVPSLNPTTRSKPAKTPPPTLASTTEGSRTPTIVPTTAETPRPELSWQQAFDVRVNLIGERAILGKDGVFVDNLNYDDGYGMSSKPISLDSPFGIALQFDYQGSGRGVISAADMREANPWWKDMRRVWITFESNEIRLNFFDGTSEQAAGSIPLPGLDPTSHFNVIFSDPQGKKLTVLDENGKVIREVDVTKLGQGTLANGLFPERTMYAGWNITPRSQMNVYQYSLLAPATSNLFHLYETKALLTPPLRELARRRGITLGVEIDINCCDTDFYFDARYQQTVAREFEAVTDAGSGTSWTWAIHPNSPDFDWTKTEQVISFVERAGLKLSWDCIVFASDKTPEWLLNGGYSRDQILGILQDHIETVVPRYKGLVTEWGVVSEADWSGGTNTGQFLGFPTSPGGELLGQFLNGRVGAEAYIDRAFRWTRQADPNGVLTYINAFNETVNRFSDFEYDFLAKMKRKGMPIDAIGFEMNLQASDFKTDADIQAWKESVKRNTQRFGDLGLQVVIKELTVNVGNVKGKTRDEKFELQAKIYKAAVESCLESEGICRTIYLGGLTDTTSWLYYPGYAFGKAEAPNILDEYYNPKPAYFAIRDALLGE